MIGNVRVVSRCVPLPAFAKVFPVVSLSGNSRSICWAASLASPRAPALYRAANTGRKGTSALPPLPEASLQNLLDVESRILRYASCIAVYMRMTELYLELAQRQWMNASKCSIACTGASVQRQLLIPRTRLLLRSHPGPSQCMSRREVSRRAERSGVGLRAGSRAWRAGSWMTACTASGPKTSPGASGRRC